MGIKKYKPTSPGRRFQSVLTFDEITTVKPHKPLLAPLKKKGGRNSLGRITCRHRGGGHKRMYRKIDFKRDKFGIPAKVASIEYDPNRSARIALLHYFDGEKRYILAPLGVRIGDVLEAGENVDIRPGNALPLRCMPVGAFIHNVELNKGKGGQIARSAGNVAQLLSKEKGFAYVRLPSGEIRLVDDECMATVGQLGNVDWLNVVFGKAGRKRWLGKRPRVRGVAMNPVDHPHGGGEGKSSGGRHPCTPWGKPTKGYKTRRPKHSDKYIVRPRKK